MKRFFALLLALSMALSMAACAAEDAVSEAAETSEAAEITETVPVAEETESGDTDVSVDVPALVRYPLTITDQAGRSVTIRSEPQRIVSGYYISTSLLIALGQEDKLVGIEAKADKRPVYRLSAPELLDLPSVGSAKEFDLEGCAALEPDLVILPMKLKDAADTLDSLGIPTMLVNPENQELLDQARDLVAQALDCRKNAEALAEFTASTKASLETALASAEKPRVYLASNSAFLSTAGKNMYQSSLIELAGGENVASEIEDSYWAEVSYEQLLAWNPDYIILAAEASYTADDVLADPNLAGITAIEEGRVYQMPSKAEAWDSPVPGGILGAVWMAAQLHRDQFPEGTEDNMIEEFYETFYGFSYAQSEN